MSTTANMNLELPIVSTTLGPEWATELNAALEVVDGHDHSSGKGIKVPVSGLNMNAHLNFEEFKAYNLRSVQFVADLAAALTGATNAGSVHMYNGNLYFTNGSGTAIQLTAGASPVTTPGTFQTLEVTTAAGDLTISSSDTFVQINVDTTSSRTITLPPASSVAEGRVYVIKDATGDCYTNNMTIAPDGADTIDGEVSLNVDSDFATVWVSSDGVANWTII
jgi:hypothetical protein